MMLKENDDENESCTTTTTTSSSSNTRQSSKKSDCSESQRVYKKSSPNSILTLYLGSRELISRCGIVEPLKGVIYVDPKFIAGHRLYGQLTLIFRYGREDEEVMGLKFCNEAVIALKQIYPMPEEQLKVDDEELTPLQEALIERLGKGAYPFSIKVSMIAPPSVQLIPAKKYNGAPIGTSYDIRIYIADTPDEKLQRRSTVKLDIRLINKISPYLVQPPIPSIPRSLKLKLSPMKLRLVNRFEKTFREHTSSTNFLLNSSGTNKTSQLYESSESEKTLDSSHGTPTLQHNSLQNQQEQTIHGPEGSIYKPFLWAEGRVSMRANLNKPAYGHGEKILVSVEINNESRKIVKKIRVYAVQHVDVCMFSNGKFKNVVADINVDTHITTGNLHKETYTLQPAKGTIKNWIAIEGSLVNTNSEIIGASSNTRIASSAPRGPQSVEERNVFAIYVSYYVKIKLSLSGMGGEVSLKLPFVLGYLDEHLDKMHSKDCGEYECSGGEDNIVALSNIDVVYEEEENDSLYKVCIEKENEFFGIKSIVSADVHDGDSDDSKDKEK